MKENRPEQTRIEDLLSQDAVVSSFEFDEFRQNLEESLHRLEERARVIRRASLWGLGIFLACIASIIPLEMLGLTKYEWVAFVWSGCGTVAMFATGVLAGIYQYKYQPALNRAKSELQSTMFAQLQQQVAEISRKLDNQ
jgi:hypothetical protein